MQSDYPVSRISPAAVASLHAYYDVCPESPDASRVTFFGFDGEAIPGPGKVYVAGRNGEDPTPVSGSTQGIGHVGAFPEWLSNHEVAWRAEALDGSDTTFVRDLRDDSLASLPGQIRQYHHAAGRAAVTTVDGRGAGNPHALRKPLRLFERDAGGFGELAAVSRELAYEACAGAPERCPIEQTIFMNCKWAPDGQSLFAVYNNEPYRKKTDDLSAPRFKSLLWIRPGANGACDVTYLGQFGHHPMWAPNGRFVFAMCPGKEGQDLVAFDLEKITPQGAAQTVLLENAPGVHSSLHPDGRRLIIDVFKSPEPEQGSLMLYDLETKERCTLAVFNHRQWDHQNGHHPHPVWSHDRKRIYFNAQDEGPCGVYALDLGE